MTQETERNRAAVASAFEAWTQGKVSIADLFAPEMTWRIEGRSVLSRDYRDRQDFLDATLEPFARRFGAHDRFRPVDVRAILADADRVAVLWTGRGSSPDGEVYENTYAWFLRLDGGLITDGVVLFDSITLNDFWAATA